MGRLFGLIFLLTAAFSPTRPAKAEIRWDYVKPSSEQSTGEWLADILGVSEFGRSYAVIIGLSRFEYFNPLDATEDDPQRVFEFLRDEAGFDYILMLRDEEVTYQALRDLFEFELPNTLRSNDRFLLFWSGHGTQFKNARGVEVGYLPLISSSEDNKATMVNMADFERWDGDLPAKQALFLLDACFSGLAGMAAQSDDEDLEIRDLSKPGHHIISAGRSDEQTIASRQEWEGSIFTHALLKALRGGADRYGGKGAGDGVINLHELVAYMGETVKHAKAAAGWNRPLRPVLNVFPGRGEGQFFFLTNEKKRTYLEAQGMRASDEMAHGMPVIMGAAEGAPAATGESYGGRDATVFDVIKESTITKDFEDFIGQFPSSAFAPYARNRVALLRQRETATLPPSVLTRLDPATEEASLNLRPEDRRVVQEALTALGFDTQGRDGIFGANTRRAVVRWQRDRSEEPTGYLTAAQYGKLLVEAEPKLTALTPDSSIQPDEMIDVGVYYALVIGNSEYQSFTSLRALTSPRVDAEAMAALLEQEYGYRVMPLLNATRGQILGALNVLRGTLVEEDNLLIYYAGHGFLDPDSSRCYWLPVDAEPYPQTANWISTEDVTDILNSMRAKHVLVVADSCYSLTATDDAPMERGVPEEQRSYWLKTIANKPARMALTSGSLSPVLDGGGGRHSIFARALLEVLGTNDRVMEGWRVYLRVSARVSDVAQVYGLRQVPTYGPIRSEKYAGGDFLFVRS